MQAIRRLLPAILVVTSGMAFLAPPPRAETATQTLASAPLAIPAPALIQAPANPAAPPATSPPVQAAPPQQSVPAPGSPREAPAGASPFGGYQCERSRPTS